MLYENVVMDEPEQWSIWIGPQQAIYGGACSLFWPYVPGQKCPVPGGMTWDNIVLRNITINKPKYSPGVILGNSTKPMTNLVFDNVVVNDPGIIPWGEKHYECRGVKGAKAIGGTKPVPPCFDQLD